MGRKIDSIRELMTPDPICLDADASVGEAARSMRDANVGDVLVRQEGRLIGIVTDRDLVVRCLASESERPQQARLGDLCTGELVTLTPDARVERAIELMQDKAVRRIPIVESGRAVGIVSLGDLAIERDRRSTLGEISAAPPNN